FLAFWELGMVVVPFDPGLPRERVGRMKEGAKIAWVVDEERIQKEIKKFSPEQVDPDHAVVFFTSGTTGQPKGILGSRKGITEFLLWQRDEFGVGPGDRIPQLTGFGFDVVIRDIFLALVSGATLCLPPRALNLATPLQWLADQRVTRLHVVPSLVQSWLTQEGDLPDLKTSFFAGEPLTGRLVRRWRERGESTRVINLYGPAETTLARCSCDVTYPRGEGILPIGQPVPGTQVLVIGADDEPVPVGSTGEIAIRSFGASHGYLGGKSWNDGSLFRTGDLGRVSRDHGMIDILGRIDDQVKIRGVRIQPGEIAAVLARHDQVKTAFVQIDPARKVEFTAYLTGEEVSRGTLREYLEGILPVIMIPTHFVWMSEFPVTPNGKIDREELPAALDSRTALSRAPETEMECELATVWTQLLGRAIEDVHLSFFEAGGYSLSAAQLAVMIEERWKARVEIRDLFENSTIAEQAFLIEHAPTVVKFHALEEPEIGKRIEATASQHRMWFAESGGVSRSLYNIPGSLRVEGNLDPEFFEKKLNQCLQLHGSIFTTFTVEGGKLYQSQGERGNVRIRHEDFSRLESKKAEKQVRVLAREQLAEPFPIFDSVLFRGLLIRLSKDEHVFVYVFSHLVFDGWSHRVFVRDFLDLLGGEELDERTSFLAVAGCQELRSGPDERSLRYWKQRFEGFGVPLELPFNQHPSEKPAFESGHLTREIDSKLNEATRRAALRYGATPFMIHLAVLTRLLHEVSGEEDLCVGTPVANRRSSECDDIVGCFINTLAIRSQLSEGMSLLDHVERVRDSALEAFEHQSVPINEVVRLVNPQRASWHAPLFQVLLNLLNEEESQFDLSNGLKVERISVAHAETKFFLTVYVHWREDSSTLHFSYHGGLFSEEQVSDWAEEYLALLSQIVREPGENGFLKAPGELSLTRRAGRSYLPDEPESSTEILVAEVWKRLLGVDVVERMDHFFELGGHSLLAMQVMHEISEELGRTLSVHLLEDFPVLQALATAIDVEESPKLPGIEVQDELL
ncbi:MAG: condensation domain-containing protein, partial [Verrucomicrobiota bacterium]